MLDGILGRGFSSKCKSLIKAVRARIEVVRRRAEAKQRFLKEDLAKLLINGLDINAYGRTEEFLAGLSLLSCYDFIEKSCDCVIKQLSRIDRQGECPEECREAVASLMFAAARFSDLPELRDLRDIFQQRYGNSLEVFVNQTFTEKLYSRPPALAKRLQVLHDITSEFSVKWDSKGFEQRMTTPVVQVDAKKVVVEKMNGHVDMKNKIRSRGDGNIMRSVYSDDHFAGTQESVKQQQKSLLKEGDDDDDIKFTRHNNGQGNNKTGEKSEASNGKKHRIAKTDANLQYVMSNGSPLVKIPGNDLIGGKRHINGICNSGKGENSAALHFKNGEQVPYFAEHPGKNGCRSESSFLSETVRAGQVNIPDKSKACSNDPPLPPYVKVKDATTLPPPYTKPKQDKQTSSAGSIHIGSECDENVANTTYSRNRVNEVHCSGSVLTERGHQGQEEEFITSAGLKHHASEKMIGYENDKIPLPKPRSIRRKNHKSSPGYNGIGVDEEDSVKRSSNSRRKEHSRKGLQMVFDEELHGKDDEERMIDKLLIHYCKKPSSYDGGKLKKKVHSEFCDQAISHAGPSSANSEVVPMPTRSVSLPHDHQVASPESKKTLNRSKTFQPDNQAKHVHPKLPDYDDLAARFASLKQR